MTDRHDDVASRADSGSTRERRKPKGGPVTQGRSRSADRAPDASDVVAGPVGSAWLKDPATSGPMGADLEAVPTIDVAAADTTDEGGSIDDQAEPPSARAAVVARRSIPAGPVRR
jgi:hypothetical protein